MHRTQALPTDRPTERDVNSWVQSVEENMSTLSALNLGGNSPDINELVDDKEIATRSVAFVVNSTRKGIVPLCADVANLFKTKYTLERKIHELRRDNNILKSSLSSSLASSPTIFSQRAFLQQALPQLSRSCSRCSQCSSTTSLPRHSPKLDVSPGTKPSPAPRPSIHPSKHNGYREAEIIAGGDRYERQKESGKRAKKDLVRCVNGPVDSWNPEYLPDIVSQPDSDIPKISPRSSSDVPTETSLLQEQFAKSQDQNTQLQDELTSAKTEIEVLKRRLALLESSSLPVQQTDPMQSFHVENECQQSEIPSNQTPIPISQHPVVYTQNSHDTETHLSDSVHENEKYFNDDLTDRKSDSVANIDTKTCLAGDVSDNVCLKETPSIKTRLDKHLKFKSAINIDLNSESNPIIDTALKLSDNTKLIDKHDKQDGTGRSLSDPVDTSSVNNRKLNPSDSPSEIAETSFTDISQTVYSIPSNDIKGEDFKKLKGISKFETSTPDSKRKGVPQEKCTRSDRIPIIKSLMSCRLINGVQVLIGDNVQLHDRRCGRIKYIGPLDERSRDMYVGIELNGMQGGNHDGTYNSRRYFQCAASRGVMVPVADVATRLRQTDKELSDYGSDSDREYTVSPPEKATRQREKKYRKRRTPTPDSMLNKCEDGPEHVWVGKWCGKV